MTTELLKEVLESDQDPWLAEQVLERQDLPPELLEVALKNPDLHLKAARHKNLSEESHAKLVLSHDTPEGLRQELLQKNIGHISFPQLNENGVHHTATAMGTKEFRLRHQAPDVDELDYDPGMTVANRTKTPTPNSRRKFISSVRPGLDINSHTRIFGTNPDPTNKDPEKQTVAITTGKQFDTNKQGGVS